jgi:hypothetical protein
MYPLSLLLLPFPALPEGEKHAIHHLLPPPSVDDDEVDADAAAAAAVAAVATLDRFGQTQSARSFRLPKTLRRWDNIVSGFVCPRGLPKRTKDDVFPLCRSNLLFYLFFPSRLVWKVQ